MQEVFSPERYPNICYFIGNVVNVGDRQAPCRMTSFIIVGAPARRERDIQRG
jgi:hypothetical protein